MPGKRRHRIGPQEINRTVFLQDFVMREIDRRRRFNADRQRREPAVHAIQCENDSLAVIQCIASVGRCHDRLARYGLPPLHLEKRIVLQFIWRKADKISKPAFDKTRNRWLHRVVTTRPLA